MTVVTINGIPHFAAQGTRLQEALTGEHGFSMPCGGHGRCGKCRVKAQGKLSMPGQTERKFLSEEELAEGIRLACLAKVEGDCSVELTEREPAQVRVGGEMQPFSLSPAFTAYGAAIDIGTTTLAGCLYDAGGNMLSEAGCLNPQSRWGADVISRIEAALGGAARDQAAAVRKGLDGLLAQLAGKAGIETADIDGLVITGNTAMLHLLTGESVEPLSHAPFAVRRRFGETLPAAELGLESLGADVPVFLPVCISAFVGADLVTAMMASGFRERSGTHLLTDIGTNGEMALLHEGRLLVCSTAAGPAFEGAGLSRGMQGTCGAIDKVTVRNGKLACHTIGEGEAVGICGSGVVDALACLLETGQIDETGYLENNPAKLTGEVTFSQEDVRMVQLAKAAVHGGIRTLLHYAGIGCGEVSELLIAGGFGSYLDVDSAGKIGLIPREMAPAVRVIGNAALKGAALLLLNSESRTACRQYAECAEVIELSADPFFAEEYIERMLF